VNQSVFTEEVIKCRRYYFGDSLLEARFQIISNFFADGLLLSPRHLFPWKKLSNLKVIRSTSTGCLKIIEFRVRGLVGDILLTK
jgi:hypothetical protein